MTDYEFKQKISQILMRIAQDSKLTEEERIVARFLCDSWSSAKAVQQNDIAKEFSKLGSHPEHEKYASRETTLRKVRQVVRDLRITHGMPILSSKRGYFLPATEAEAEQYLVRVEALAKSQARAWFETYGAMKKSLGMQSEFFESQRSIYDK